MPPKKKSEPKATGAPEDFTPERFERELKDLASKARQDASANPTLAHLATASKTILVLSLLGVAANASQLNLSPVYGGIPSAINHGYLLMAGAFFGWAGNLFFKRMLDSSKVSTPQLLPVVACYIPMVQWFLFGFSEKLGATYGPLLTEALTLFPLTVFSAASVADYLDGAQVPLLPSFMAESAPGIGSWSVFQLVRHFSGRYLHVHIGQFFVLTRLGLEMMLAASYTVFAPSKLLLATLPALLHTAMFNPHMPTSAATTALNTTLLADNWMLLERKESLTGYVSVLENMNMGYRVMRCDHSLLGGEWVMLQGQKISEPIYGVFVMLEAVRLIEREVPIRDQDASALVVGLGIGTTPSALVEHGIDTTVVEIDPVVYEFAGKYFNLKENNQAAIADAVSHTASLVEEGKQYDYIVHDVFTGGAEPVDLFTLEFLQGLSSLLKPDGVIAINYAGDFGLPTPKMIVRTIKQVFPTCRIFREAPRDEKVVAASGSDFTNMVIFCHKTDAPLTFRPAMSRDYLNSRARQVFLEPKHEVKELEFLDREDAEQKDLGLLLSNSTEKVLAWHRESAMGHWKIMRTVIEAKIWERW